MSAADQDLGFLVFAAFAGFLAGLHGTAFFAAFAAGFFGVVLRAILLVYSIAMTLLNDNGEPTLFSAVLTPHRSLSATGFLIVMTLVGGVSFTSGMVFLLIGAWPVVGFFGLDALLIYLAFRANYRAGTAFEEVSVQSSQLRVRKVSHRGRVSEWTLNPAWVRLEREVHPEFGIERLLLVSHGRKLSIAGFLSPDEKASFAGALTAAIGEARRGVTRNTVQ